MHKALLLLMLQLLLFDHLHTQACCKSKKEYTYGRSKVFIRHPRTVFELEGLRKMEVVKLAIIIQRVYRGWHQWRKVHMLG